MQFSVVVALYNKSQTIGRAIKSILKQSYGELEVVVVDDGSTDNGAKVVENFKDSRMRLVRQNNSGVSSARNKGISIANYSLIAFLDADDVWKPCFLDTIVELIRGYPDAVWYGTNYERKTGNRKVLACNKISSDFIGKTDDFFGLAVGELPIHISSVVIRRAALSRVGMFPEGVKYGEDQDLFCRLALHDPLIYNAKICTTYFLDSENRACKRTIIPEVWPFLKEYKSHLVEVNVDTANSIKKFVARRLLTRAKALKDTGETAEAKQSIADAELTGMLCEHCQKARKYCDTPMPVIRLMIQYRYYMGRVRGLLRRVF